MNWELKPASDLCHLAIDCVNKTAPLAEHETPYRMLRTTNIKNGFIDFENVRYVEQDVFKKWTRRAQPKYGDVLFTREAPVGEVGRFTSETGDYFLGQRTFLYRPDPDKLDWNFLAYVLQSPQIQGWVNGIAYGATVPHMKVGDMEHLKIPVPPLSIQKKIAGILSAYDDLIENNLKRIKLLEEIAHITFEEWFVRLRFPGHETTPIKSDTGLPEGWDSSVVSAVVSINPKTNVPKGCLQPYFPMQSVSTTSMVIEPVKTRVPSGGAKFQNGDTLVARITPCLENGKTGFVILPEPDSKGTGSTEFIVLRETPSLSRYYIYCLARGDRFRGNSINSMVGSDGRQRVNSKIYDKLKINVPSRKYMSEFDNLIKPCFDQISNFTKQNQCLHEARDILLPRLMTGMIDVEQYNPSDLLKEVA